VKAVVLCGGLGTRLGELTRDVPKPLLDVAGRPFMHYVLGALAASGIDDVTLATSFQSEMISQVYGDAWNGMRVRYSVEEQPLGTGGAIRQAMDVAGARQALVLNGDTLFDIDFEALLSFHAARDAQATIAVRRVPDVSRYGAVSVAGDHRIVRFGEKREHGEGLINAGVYVVQSEVFDGIHDERFSFEQKILADGAERLRLFAMEAAGYFIDIGIPEDLARAARDLKEKHGNE
jgi:D-glycero-alpha-D-manno-heptose 1-phosphate guanylyltransferase